MGCGLAWLAIQPSCETCLSARQSRCIGARHLLTALPRSAALDIVVSTNGQPFIIGERVVLGPIMPIAARHAVARQVAHGAVLTVYTTLRFIGRIWEGQRTVYAGPLVFYSVSVLKLLAGIETYGIRRRQNNPYQCSSHSPFAVTLYLLCNQ